MGGHVGKLKIAPIRNIKSDKLLFFFFFDDKIIQKDPISFFKMLLVKNQHVNL